jgi:hypothetical protein
MFGAAAKSTIDFAIGSIATGPLPLNGNAAFDDPADGVEAASTLSSFCEELPDHRDKL